MKQFIGDMILSTEFQNSLFAPAVRKLTSAMGNLYSFSTDFLCDMQATERPHYAYSLLNAAKLAKRLGKSRISAIEFGVAGGNGLVFMCDFAEKVTRATGIKIDCYGFDTGEGMPAPEGPKDLPYWFRTAQYRMDQDALRRRIPRAKLMIGNVKDTLKSFIVEHRPAPIGAIMNDVDYWSSTSQSFDLFDYATIAPECFLPRIFMYFDDIIGTEMEMYGRYNGQLSAIEEFNVKHDTIKIQLNQNLLGRTHIKFRLQIYYAHLFDHPQYSQYIGDELQQHMENLLKLQERRATGA